MFVSKNYSSMKHIKLILKNQLHHITIQDVDLGIKINFKIKILLLLQMFTLTKMEN